MTISIRPATEQDCALILRFITELAVYEKAADQVEATVETLASSLFGAGTPARADLRSGRAAGGLRHLFLQLLDLAGQERAVPGRPVRLARQPRHRRRQRLLRHLARVAVEEGCGRFEWSVLDWNQPAIDFYQSIGARPQAEWVRYRMHGEALTGFAAGSD